MGEKNSKELDPNLEINSNEKLDFELNKLDKLKKKYSNKANKVISQTLYNIALEYKTEDNVKLSLEHGLESLEMNKVLSEYGAHKEKPCIELAKSFNLVSVLYSSLKQYDTSLSMCKQSVEVYEKLYKKEPSKDLANQLSNLAKCYFNLNDDKKAIFYSLKCLKMRQELSQNDQDLAKSFLDLGFYYSKSGDVFNGLNYSNKSKEIFDKLGNNNFNIDYAILLNNLSNDCKYLEKYEPSLIYALESLEINLNIFGRRCCFELANSLKIVGFAYECLNDYSNSLKYCLISYKMFKLIAYSGTEEMGELASTISLCYSMLNDKQNCLKYLIISYEHYKNYFKSPNSKLARLLTNISIVHNCLGDVNKALEYSIEALNMYENSYNNKQHSNIDLARAYMNLGSAYGNIGNPVQCLENSLKSLNIFQSLPEYDMNSYEILLLLHNIASSYDDLGDDVNFVNYAVECIELNRELEQHGLNQHDLAILLKNTSLSLFKQNIFKLGLKYALEALEIAQSLYLEPHPLVCLCLYTVSKFLDENLKNEFLIKALKMKSILKNMFNLSLSFDQTRYDDNSFDYKLNVDRDLTNNSFIMISYYGDINNRHECLEIKDILEENYFQVYADLDYKHKTSLDKMMRSVDSSQLLIVCINEAYLKNGSSRLEIEYAVSQNKIIIPVVLEHDLLVKKWLEQHGFSSNIIDYQIYDYDKFRHVLLKHVNTKLNLIKYQTNSILNQLKKINFNLLNKIDDLSHFKSLNMFNSKQFENIFELNKSNENEYNKQDIEKFKQILNDTFLVN